MMKTQVNQSLSMVGFTKGNVIFMLKLWDQDSTPAWKAMKLMIGTLG